MKRLLGICFRLSIVAAVLTAVVSMIDSFRTGLDFERSNHETRMSLECAAQRPAEELQRIASEDGKLDISRFGCAPRRFIASLSEIDDARRGVHPREVRASSFVNPMGSMVLGVVVLIAVNLIGLAAAGAWFVGRWVVRGRT